MQHKFCIIYCMQSVFNTGIVGLLGDILVQCLQGHPFNFHRMIVFSLVTAVYITPVIHVWFNMLNALPFLSRLNNTMKANLMIIIDQTFGAVIITAGFFYAFEIANRIVPPYTKHLDNVIIAGNKAIKHNLWETMIANWYCWPGKTLQQIYVYI
jgi:hypothetical protein